MRKPFNYTFGGKSRSVTMEIGHAVEIENATGMGIIALMDKMRALKGNIGECTAILSVALAANGQPMAPEQIMRAAMVEGLVDFQVTALSILNQLFIAPTEAEKKPSKKNGAADPLAVTP